MGNGRREVRNGPSFKCGGLRGAAVVDLAQSEAGSAGRRYWYFIAKHSAPAPHMPFELRYLL